MKSPISFSPFAEIVPICAISLFDLIGLAFFFSSSTIAATILTKTDRRFGYVAIPLAVLIALSRLYLYVHFPSDVFAAALLGLLIGELTFRYGGKLFDKISRSQKQ